MAITTSPLELILSGSPYSLSVDGLHRAWDAIREAGESLDLLRAGGKLSDRTVEEYYGRTIFEQVAESNAIEGSTLSVGETEAAILRGTTLTGHDPGFVKDAHALHDAMRRLAQMARENTHADIDSVRELHELIMDGRASAGQFRSHPVLIRGSKHHPPKTWGEVMSQMEAWAAWSKEHASAPAIVRASVLHAWLAHIHPFSDGNGRTARAVSTLELVRAGSPPVIVKKVKHRNRYLESLAASDVAGDIGPFLEFMLERHRDAIRSLLQMSAQEQGLTAAQVRIRDAQRRRLDVWNRSVELLATVLVDRLGTALEPLGGACRLEMARDGLAFEDYLDLVQHRPISRSWAFAISLDMPGLSRIERLAWVGYRSSAMRQSLSDAGPTLFWSRRNPSGFPPWLSVSDAEAPGLSEMTCDFAHGDRWFALGPRGTVQLSTGDLAQALASGFMTLLGSQ